MLKQTKIIGGNLNYDAILTHEGDVTLNEDSGNWTFRVESNTDTKLIFINASEDKIYIGDGNNQRNFTMYSPDLTEWNCGVNNAGNFVCS